MRKALTKLLTPASDRLVCHDHAALEKQFLDVAQAQLEAEIPSNSAADDTRRETVTVIERFRFLHRAILSDESRNLTTPFKATTDSNHSLPVAPDLLQRDFSPARPDKAWSTDITYIWTDEGWLYLTVILDLFSRQVVGWSMQPHMRTELVSDALRMAWFRRRPEAGLIVHSDRGSQYCSHDFQDLLKGYGMRSSMSRRGNCWERADRELVGIAQASTHPWPALCNASRSDGRGNRLVELLQSFALALDVGLRQSDAVRAGLVRCPEPTGGIISLS